MSKRNKQGYTRKQERILDKTGGMCSSCGERIKTHSEFSQDHDMPQSRGGINGISNMLPMHKWCNVEKGCRTYEELVEDYDTERNITRMIQRQREK